MYIGHVNFGKCPKEKDPDIFFEECQYYLFTMEKNDQLWSPILSWINFELVAYVQLPRANSFSARNNCDFVKNQLKKIREFTGRNPSWAVLKPHRQSFHKWKTAEFLFLQTTALDAGTAICHGKTGQPLPVYELPLSPLDGEDIYYWRKSYFHFDNVWIQSSALEMESYREIADPFSELSNKGRDICKIIETKTGLPTYYYLTRYYAFSSGEEDRLCPGCGRKWATPNLNTEEKPFHKFHFKCDRCRLVSHYGTSFEGKRKARIGDYNPKAQKKRPIK